MNFGKGLALPPGGAGRTATAVDRREQNCLANGVDLASDDPYWFTDPWTGRLSVLRLQVRRQHHRTCATPTRPTASATRRGVRGGRRALGRGQRPRPGAPRPAPRSAQRVWHSIIAGARDPVLPALLRRGVPGRLARDPLQPRRDAPAGHVRRLNSSRALAPVLNSPFGRPAGTRTAARCAAWSSGTARTSTCSWPRLPAVCTGWFSTPCLGDATATVARRHPARTARHERPVHGQLRRPQRRPLYRIDGGTHADDRHR